MEKALKEGKCIKNVEGRLVLPGGGYIPRHILGKNMSNTLAKSFCLTTLSKASCAARVIPEGAIT